MWVYRWPRAHRSKLCVSPGLACGVCSDQVQPMSVLLLPGSRLLPWAQAWVVLCAVCWVLIGCTAYTRGPLGMHGATAAR